MRRKTSLLFFIIIFACSHGLSCGVNFDLGSHFTVDAKLSFISTTSLAIKFFYVF